MDVTVITVIACSVTTITSAIGLVIRQRFKLADHREERQLFLLLVKAGLVKDFDHYTKLRQAEQPQITLIPKQPPVDPDSHSPPSIGP